MIHHLQDTISAPFQAKTAAAGTQAFTFFNRLKAYSLPNVQILLIQLTFAALLNLN